MTRLPSRRNSTASLRSGRGVAVGGNMAWGDSKAPGSVAAAQQRAAYSSMRSSWQNHTSTFLLGDGEAIQMLLTNLLPFGRKSCWLSGRTASLKLSEVKHVPAQVVLRSMTQPQVTCSNPSINLCPSHAQTLPGLRDLRELNPEPQRSLCRGVVTQMGIEPETTRCLVGC